VPITASLKSHDLYLVLRDRIASGAWTVGDRLPGEIEIAAAFDVSRTTARRALGKLTDEGLIARRPGAGTRIIATPDALRETVSASEILSLQSLGARATFETLADAQGETADAIVRELGLPEGTPTRQTIRLVRIDGRAVGYLTRHATLACPPRLSHARQRYGAELATPEMAGHLTVEVGSALLAVTRVAFAMERTQAEHVWALFAPERAGCWQDVVGEVMASPV
jgi:GntR family transcriptional regulator